MDWFRIFVAAALVMLLVGAVWRAWHGQVPCFVPRYARADVCD